MQLAIGFTNTSDSWYSIEPVKYLVKTASTHFPTLSFHLITTSSIMDNSLKIGYALTVLAFGGMGQSAVAQSVPQAPAAATALTAVTPDRAPTPEIRSSIAPERLIASPESHTLNSAEALLQLEVPVLPPPTLPNATIVAATSIESITPTTAPTTAPTTTPTTTSNGVKLETLTTNFQNESDGNRVNRIIEPQAQLLLPNGDRLQVKTGWNTFQQSGIETVQNFPLQAAWVKPIGNNKLKLGGGVDVFNRLSVQPKLNAEIEVPVGIEISPQGKLNRGVVFKGLVDYGAYKFNAKTLEKGINVVHVKPEVYWQIDPQTSFYSHYQLGLYNDNNVEHQTFSRLERKLGNFFVAANLFTWNYKADRELTNGYFSPKQFLTYTGEVGWSGDVAKGLNCRLTAGLGQQSLNANSSNISQYNARCSAAIAPNVALDFGYGVSNERKQNLSSSNYHNQSLTSQLRVTF
jgi:hypothetical protein